MWLWGGVVDGFDSAVAAREGWPRTRASTPFLSEQIRLNWGWENIFPKFIRQMRAYRGVQNKGQKSYLITLYIKSNMKLLDGVIFYKSRLSIHLW